MIRLALILALLASPVAAQNFGNWSPADEWTLDRDGPDRATISFYNSDPPSFGSFPAELVNGDLTVGIYVEISQGPEVMTVTPPEGWIAVPPVISVIDGETGTVELFRGEFLGM